MKRVVSFKKIINVADFNKAKEFLNRMGYPVIESEPIEEIKSSKTASKNHIPHSFNLTVLDKNYKRPIKASLYFTDFELTLDCKVFEENFIKDWQIFNTLCLKGSAQHSYVKSIEQEMVENLKATDRVFIDDMMQNPDIEDELADRHDEIIKRIIFSFDYLKIIEKKLGFLHKESYNPFAHPCFNKKEPQPRLVDIVEASNRREKEQRTLTETQKEAN